VDCRKCGTGNAFLLRAHLSSRTSGGERLERSGRFFESKLHKEVSNKSADHLRKSSEKAKLRANCRQKKKIGGHDGNNFSLDRRGFDGEPQLDSGFH